MATTGRAALVAVLAAMCVPAHAIVITGTFSGKASIKALNGNWPLDIGVNDIPTAGVITLDTAAVADETRRFPGVDGIGLVFRSSSPFRIMGEAFLNLDLPVPDSFRQISLSNSVSGAILSQQVTLSTSTPDIQAAFTFVDLDNKLFAGFDLATFNPAQVDVSRSFATFTRTGMNFVSISFDQLTFTSVPEPAPFALMCAGLLALLVGLRVRDPQNRSQGDSHWTGHGRRYDADPPASLNTCPLPSECQSCWLHRSHSHRLHGLRWQA